MLFEHYVGTKDRILQEFVMFGWTNCMIWEQGLYSSYCKVRQSDFKVDDRY